MKKISMLFLLLCLVLCLFLDFNTVSATDEISSVGNGAANYYVEEVIESEELDFGIKYHNDSAYLNTADTAYIAPGTYAAGGSKYGTEEFVPGKYYTANVNVLEIPNEEDIDIVPYANIKNGRWTLTTVATMINNYEATHPNKRVIAAVNGDYFDIDGVGNYPYTSTGGTVSEGNYFKVNTEWKNIGFKNDGSDVPLIGNVISQTSQKPMLEIIENDEVVYQVQVDGLNKMPGTGETTCYFAFYNSSHAPIEVEVENAYFVTGNQIAPYSENSVYGFGQISEIGSGKVSSNKFAITTSNSVLREYLKTDVTVRVQYSYVGQLEGVENVIGYPDNIIVDGEPVMTNNYRHPRTMIGLREDGTIIMTTIDGRQISKGYYGASPVEQAALMQYYGCVQAYNLDGGGSTTIIIRQNGEFVVKNSPSDGSERHDGNCLLVVAEVPSLNIESLNITEDSFDIKIDVIKMIEKYKNLYIAVNGEKRKIEDTVMTFSGLDTYTSYVYKIYALIDGQYFGLPYTGIISTAKQKFEINNAILEKVIKEDGLQYYHFTFEVDDQYNTIQLQNIRINGEKINVQNNEVYIPVEKGLPLSEFYLIFVYDLKDNNGRIDFVSKEFKLTFKDADTALNTIFDSIDAKLDKILNE